MKLVLPILFFALFIGLVTKRMTPILWMVVGAFVAAMITYAYLKPI